MNSHTNLQKNDLESFMKDNDCIGTDMNETFHNGYMSSGIGLLNSHNTPQDNEWSKPIEMNISFDNGDINGDYLYINSSTGSVIRNNNSIEYKNKIDEISTRKDLMGNNGLTDGVDIDNMLPECAPNQYVNME